MKPEIEAAEFVDTDEVNALMQKVQVLEFPDMHKSSTVMTTSEEQSILSKYKFRKSDVKFVVAQGTICRCGHGKNKHSHGYNSHRAGSCNLKTCDCYCFSKPAYN